jgi:hypothetical protein
VIRADVALYVALVGLGCLFAAPFVSWAAVPAGVLLLLAGGFYLALSDPMVRASDIFR